MFVANKQIKALNRNPALLDQLVLLLPPEEGVAKAFSGIAGANEVELFVSTAGCVLDLVAILLEGPLEVSLVPVTGHECEPLARLSLATVIVDILGLGPALDVLEAFIEHTSPH